jgi:hypothetical protein
MRAIALGGAFKKPRKPEKPITQRKQRKYLTNEIPRTILLSS